MFNVYKASAGSGKTFRLTKDYIHLLFDSKKQISHRNILAVTYTNKATEEMKSRIIHELFLLSTGKDSPYRADLMEAEGLSAEDVNKRAKQIIIQILHDYSSFSISTIDSFFQKVIRAFVRDIGVNGGYTLELDSELTLNQAVDNLFVDLSNTENKQLLEWLTSYAEDRIQEGNNWDMRYEVAELGQEIFKESYQHKATETNEKLHDREFLNKYKRELNIIVNNFRAKTKDIANKALEIIKDFDLETIDFKGGKNSSIKTFNKFLDGEYKFLSKFRVMAEDVVNCYTGPIKGQNKPIIYRIIAAYNNGLQAKMIELIDFYDKEFTKYNSAILILTHFDTMGILSDLAMQIRKLTVEQNIMLISDSNLLLNKIIDDCDTPFIYERTGLMIENYMIDEFQDTSILQWKNFLPLIHNSLSNGNKSLVVGDVKQSIYRWRNSDWKLLDSQIYQDIPNINEENLDTNWRSDENVIKFNNALFRSASQKLQQLLNTSIGDAVNTMPKLADLQEKILHAYKETEQKVSAKAGKGKVEIQFIDKNDADDGWKNYSLNLIPSIMEDLQLRGYKPCDVAFLVRVNDEASEIVQKIQEYKNSPGARTDVSYEIMGTEGLLVASAVSVQFLIGVLHLWINPNDYVHKVIIGYEYAKHVLKLQSDEALKLALRSRNDDNQAISPMFSQEINDKLASFRQLSLFELTEKIIDLFDLPSWNNETIFIQAFQDAVYKYVANKTSDINSFLQWWTEKGTKLAISTPNNEQAFKLMTIHKSKGLEFKVVIIPFCDWTLNKTKKVIWCETQEYPFNKLPIIPVPYNSKLGESTFAENYFDELMHSYIDSLNLTYVAFTRAKSELIAICPISKTTSKEVSSISSLLYSCFNNKDDSNILTSNFDADVKRFAIGESLNVIQKEVVDKKDVTTIDKYPVEDFSGRLKLRHKIGFFNRDEIDITETPLDYGNLMHEIFCKIQKPDDHHSVIRELISEGKITNVEAEKIALDIEEFWKLPETAAWFRDGVEILNETTILTPTGHHYRPDRIILDGKDATVIDYKFGEQKLNVYNKQVKNYTQILNTMGYSTKAYLCYVKLKEVEEVIL